MTMASMIPSLAQLQFSEENQIQLCGLLVRWLAMRRMVLRNLSVDVECGEWPTHPEGAKEAEAQLREMREMIARAREILTAGDTPLDPDESVYGVIDTLLDELAERYGF